MELSSSTVLVGSSTKASSGWLIWRLRDCHPPLAVGETVGPWSWSWSSSTGPNGDLTSPPPKTVYPPSRCGPCQKESFLNCRWGWCPQYRALVEVRREKSVRFRAHPREGTTLEPQPRSFGSNTGLGSPDG
jgi:hypothetical protein